MNTTTNFENWHSYMMKQFHIMYERGDRCDLEISCNNQIFVVHRLILAACSEYVRELDDKQHIILPEEVPCKAIRDIIDFAYTGRIAFTKEEKKDLLLVSSLLHMPLLTELVKMEENSSFTLSIDDDETEGNDADDDVRTCTMKEAQNHASTRGRKRRANTSNRRSKQMSNGMLPVHSRMAFIQRNFSGARTLGYQTVLTDPKPSRFDGKEPVPELSMQLSFDDISYRTQCFQNADDAYGLLQPSHLKLLKQTREAAHGRKGNTGGCLLYGPIERYLPRWCSGMRSMDAICNGIKRTRTVSKPSSAASNISKDAQSPVVTAEKSDVSVTPTTTVIEKPNVSVATSTTLAEKPATAQIIVMEKPDLPETSQRAPIIETRHLVQVPVTDLTELTQVKLLPTEGDSEVMAVQLSDEGSVSVTGSIDCEIMQPSTVSVISVQSDLSSVQESAEGTGTKTNFMSNLELIELLEESNAKVADGNDSAMETDGSEHSNTIQMATESDSQEIQKQSNDEITSDITMTDIPVPDDVESQYQSSAEPVATLSEEVVTVSPVASIQETSVTEDCTGNEIKEEKITIEIVKEEKIVSLEEVELMEIALDEVQSTEMAPEVVQPPETVHKVENESINVESEVHDVEDELITVETTVHSAEDESITDETAVHNVEDESIVVEAAAQNVEDESITVETVPLFDVNGEKIVLKSSDGSKDFSKLVETLYRTNPALRNKSCKIKLIPLHGPLPNKLDNSMLNSVSPLPQVKVSQKPVGSLSPLPTSAPIAVSTPSVLPLWKQHSPTSNHARTYQRSLLQNVDGPWGCKKCGNLTFNTYHAYRLHLHGVHNEPNSTVFCIMCGYRSNKRNLQLYHQLVKHDIQPPPNVTFPRCGRCNFVALNENMLKKHALEHPYETSVNSCPCGKTFEDPVLLRQHADSGECKRATAFTCGYCRDVFERFVNLKAHMRVCMREKSQPLKPEGIKVEEISKMEDSDDDSD